MLIPIRCWTCGKVIGHLFDEWIRRLEEGDKPKDILDSMNLERYCCRRMLIAHVEILDETIKFSLTTNKLRITREM